MVTTPDEPIAVHKAFAIPSRERYASAPSGLQSSWASQLGRETYAAEIVSTACGTTTRGVRGAGTARICTAQCC